MKWPNLMLLLAVIAAPAHADPGLNTLHDALLPIRAQRDAESTTRGASAAFDPIKHGLRDWVEQHLVALSQDGDEVALAGRINQDLLSGDLRCEDPAEPAKDRCLAPRGFFVNARGYLDGVTLSRQSYNRILVLRTGVGIDNCGYDESAYAYRWNGRWENIWQNEQSNYAQAYYQPQHLYDVLVFPGEEAKHLILTLGMYSWCTSNFQGVYYRLWRVSPGDAAPRLLLDRQEDNYIGHLPPIIGSVGPTDAVIAFTGVSLDFNVFAQTEIRHFGVEGDVVRRIDPIALNPRGFVEQWLRTDWDESRLWTPSEARLEPWHAQLPAAAVAQGTFEPTTRCPGQPDQRVVGVIFAPEERTRREIWFRVLWRPPYHFQLLDAAAKPWSDCRAPDPAADEEPLAFPLQSWR